MISAISKPISFASVASLIAQTSARTSSRFQPFSPPVGFGAPYESAVSNESQVSEPQVSVGCGGETAFGEVARGHRIIPASIDTDRTAAKALL